MIKSSFQLIVTLFLGLFAATASAEAPTCPKGTMRVLVAPFENTGSQKSAIAAYSFGMAAVVAESLEADPCIHPVTGPHVLTEGLMALYTPQGKIKDASTLEAYARSIGATHLLTGSFGGQTWSLDFEMNLSGVPADRVTTNDFMSTFVTTQDLLMDVTTSRGVVVKDISTVRIHEMLSVGTESVFKSYAMEEGTPQLAPETVKAIATPGTNQAYAFLKLARAYARYFYFDLPEERYVASLKNWEAKAKYFAKRAKRKNRDKFTGRGLAATAVNIDPAYGAAQRFYAFHVEKSGKLVKARFHYELAAKARANDARSLMAAGKLELAFKNAKNAKRFFARAAEVSPRDAAPQFMLGQSCEALGDTFGAIAAFIAARNIQPSHVEARRELAQLYSAVHQDEDAAREYREIVKHRPDDMDAAFKHAASLRAAGRTNGAERQLNYYSEQFPKEARFLRFRGDMLMLLRRTAEARAVYGAAATMSKSERRAADMADGRSTNLLGGKALLEALRESFAVQAEMETRRRQHHLALTDAVLDLQQNGGEACKDGHGASSALLALQERDAHNALAVRLEELTAAFRVADRSGETAALTTSEDAGINKMLAASIVSRRDKMEMAGNYSRTFLPLYLRHKCGEYDGEVRAATIADVRARNGTRSVKRTDPGWLPKPMPFSPQIAPTGAQVVRFVVDNTRSNEDSSVFIDGTPLGTVAKGAKATFNAKAGVHRICIVQNGGNCQDDGAEHTDYLREGWIIRIRS